MLTPTHALPTGAEGVKSMETLAMSEMSVKRAAAAGGGGGHDDGAVPLEVCGAGGGMGLPEGRCAG